ncbi:uncharacterized protein Dana_GF19296 [Drosophila ananassae]|uniref:Acylphosphatase-like domain-containing protein n=1 Tax=Drosophila ananassae TaxID=7217 RepID=B3N1K6_DROAN|nr:uncharacterized protein LOC6502056 [Drosophila ananassae]EDV30115.1 uncharacterized protein Dana_GF19296 [Drosophila ananassae]
MCAKVSEKWTLYHDIVKRTEFKLYHIIRRTHFRRKFLIRCHKSNITGFVIYDNDGRDAFGVLEGLPDDINQMKVWILGRFIPEPYGERATFSAYEICFNPDRQPFCQRFSVPDHERLLADIYEDSIVKPEGRAKQRSDAEGSDKESDDESVTGSGSDFSGSD